MQDYPFVGGSNIGDHYPHWRDSNLRLDSDLGDTFAQLYTYFEKSITIRTWYFLPDRELLNALLSQAESGVSVTILLSDRTRVPFIDAANKFIGCKLAKSGARVFRYKGRYMHAKEAWNDKGDILFGSANVDWWALYSNFECDLHLNDANLARQLQQALAADLCFCRQRKSGTLRQQLLPI